MILTGSKTARERDNRMKDYYNNLRKKIKLSVNYEQAVNSNIDRVNAGVQEPPPLEQNKDLEMNDAALQKQKAFEKIKTILKKQDEAIRFIDKLEESEIVPFNNYFSRFVPTTEGLNVNDADFLIKLWDSFKKKVILSDKDLPILGTELEVYKNNLQAKADSILEYALELGLDGRRVGIALNEMVNNNDVSAMDKFYFNLLSKGPQVATQILQREIGQEQGQKEEETIPILSETVYPQEYVDNVEKRLQQLNEKRDKILEGLRQIEDNAEFTHPAQTRGQPFTSRKLSPGDKKKYLGEYKTNLRIVTNEINKVRASIGMDPIETPEDIGIEEKEEREIVPRSGSFNFNQLDEQDLDLLIKLSKANNNSIKDYILGLHPDGKFTLNGVTYNMKRNPPAVSKQLEYILKPFYERYTNDVTIPPKVLFEELKRSKEYNDFIEREMEQQIGERDKELKRIAKEKKEEDEKRQIEIERDREKSIKSLEARAENLVSEAASLAYVSKKTKSERIKVIQDLVENIAKSAGVEDDLKIDGNFVAQALEDGITNNSTAYKITNEVFDGVFGNFLGDIDEDIKKVKDEGKRTEDEDEKETLKKELTNLRNIRKNIKSGFSVLNSAIEGFVEASKSLKRDIEKNIIPKLNLYKSDYEGIRSVLNSVFEVELNDFDDSVNNMFIKYTEGEQKKKAKPKAKQKTTPKASTPKADTPKASTPRAELEEKEIPNAPPSGSGRGTKTPPGFKFGKYFIAKRALGAGMLDMRSKCNRTSTRLRRTPISSRLEKALMYIIKNNDVDVDLFEALNPEEKKLFLYAVEIAEVDLDSIKFDIFKKLNSSDIYKETDDLIDRYHVLVGQLGAGNNAPEIIRELRGILFSLLQKRKIDKSYANDLLTMLNTIS